MLLDHAMMLVDSWAPIGVGKLMSDEEWDSFVEYVKEKNGEFISKKAELLEARLRVKA